MWAAGEEAAAVYLDQARYAWSDGVLDTSEPAMLDRLREHLSIDRETASHLEGEAGTAPGT